MRAVFRSVCQCCGREYESRNVRRMYCSTRCRRDWQNDRRQRERAEEREFHKRLAWDEKPHWLQDPWARCDEGGDDLDAWLGRWSNQLLDAPTIVDDAPWDMADAAPVAKPKKRKRRKDKHKGQAFLPGMETWLS